jgi:hypothetical protein
MTRTRQRGPMRVLHIIGLVAFALASTKLCASAKQSSGAMVWFERANDRVNLRMAGAAPFHLSVRFHAYPGLEFIKGKPTILSGDGIYEETWLSLHEWEREINFAGYHALEIQSGGVRKMEATSDYEPARVAMLLDAILNPISRYALSSVLQEGREHWKIESGSKDDHPYVKISSMRSISPAITLGTAYLLMPDGVLLAWNENGLITTWQDLTEFSGRAVARHISIQADTRELVSADISVSATNERGVEPDKLVAMRPPRDSLCAPITRSTFLHWRVSLTAEEGLYRGFPYRRLRSMLILIGAATSETWS